MRTFAGWLDALFNRQRLMRRMALVWAMGLISWTVRYTFVHQPSIPGGTVAALGTVTAILGTVIGFYQHHRSKDDRAGDREGQS